MKYYISVKVSPSMPFQPNGFSYEFESVKAIDALLRELENKLLHEKKIKRKRKV